MPAAAARAAAASPCRKRNCPFRPVASAIHTGPGAGIMEDMLTTEYDGCGRCLVAVRRLSRKTDKTSSPQRQGNQDLQAAADAGGHIIAWADDWEVSGATDPMTRKGLGPWLRGEMGPYDGIVAPTVDRVGRNVRDTLNTQTLLTTQDPRRGHGRSCGGVGFSATRTRKTTGWRRRGGRRWSCARSRSATVMRRSEHGMRGNRSSVLRTVLCSSGLRPRRKSITSN